MEVDKDLSAKMLASEEAIDLLADAKDALQANLDALKSARSLQKLDDAVIELEKAIEVLKGVEEKFQISSESPAPSLQVVNSSKVRAWILNEIESGKLAEMLSGPNKAQDYHDYRYHLMQLVKAGLVQQKVKKDFEIVEAAGQYLRSDGKYDELLIAQHFNSLFPRAAFRPSTFQIPEPANTEPAHSKILQLISETSTPEGFESLRNILDLYLKNNGGYPLTINAVAEKENISKPEAKIFVGTAISKGYLTCIGKPQSERLRYYPSQKLIDTIYPGSELSAPVYIGKGEAAYKLMTKEYTDKFAAAVIELYLVDPSQTVSPRQVARARSMALPTAKRLLTQMEKDGLAMNTAFNKYIPTIELFQRLDMEDKFPWDVEDKIKENEDQVVAQNDAESPASNIETCHEKSSRLKAITLNILRENRVLELLLDPNSGITFEEYETQFKILKKAGLIRHLSQYEPVVVVEATKHLEKDGQFSAELILQDHDKLFPARRRRKKLESPKALGYADTVLPKIVEIYVSNNFETGPTLPKLAKACGLGELAAREGVRALDRMGKILRPGTRGQLGYLPTIEVLMEYMPELKPESLVINIDNSLGLNRAHSLVIKALVDYFLENSVGISPKKISDATKIPMNKIYFVLADRRLNEYIVRPEPGHRDGYLPSLHALRVFAPDSD